MRRSPFVLAALVVGLLALAPSTGMAQSENQFDPIAIASLEVTTEATDSTPAVVTLDGSNSFDPDGSIVRYKWEVLTDAYQWLVLSQDGPQSPTATFEIPVERLLERFGYVIEFRLTVTDSGSPAATASETVALRINQLPVVDIQVTAKLFDGREVAGVDDNGNGRVDENEERYAIEGVVSRPGERGNAPNEWHIRASSLLVIDASASYDPDGELTDENFRWDRLYGGNVAEVANSLPDDTRGQMALSTDEDPDTPGTEREETIAPLPASRRDNPPVAFYRLTITDADGGYATEVVKIVILSHRTLRDPDFCANRSLGGPQTYPFDSDGDGVAEVCSLRDTRRATVARQNALETLASLRPGEFEAAVLAECEAEELSEASYGDDPDDLANDVCQTREITPPPPAVDPSIADVFFSGVIDGPHFCANRSLGGPVTYPFDSNGDGVAEVCSLPYTRREAV
ncbi:MAG: hypothetical protein F4Z70_13270, partial [Acidimicrobiia bacterium]|nr:hypothetical protein [Acidimicrobiia bacterium]